MVHDRTQKVAPPEFPYDCEHETPENASRRQELAAWLTSADNPYFARSYVNRLWGYLLGVGIIEPLDDIRAGNPPTNPELLDYLTEEFIASGFNTRHIIRLIATSRTYQLSLETNPWNEDDKTNYSHALARRLPAEVLLDAVYRVTGSTSRVPRASPPAPAPPPCPTSASNCPAASSTPSAAPSAKARASANAPAASSSAPSWRWSAAPPWPTPSPTPPTPSPSSSPPSPTTPASSTSSSSAS